MTSAASLVSSSQSIFRVGRTRRILECFVHDDAAQPGADPRLSAECGKPGERPHIGSLDRVFRLVVARRNAARQAEQHSVMQPNDAPDGGLVVCFLAP
jgi:hypothetical protein